MVATASAGTAAVRKKDPAHYPIAPHAYYRLADHELHAPLLCAACFERVEPNNLFQVQTLAYFHMPAFLCYLHKLRVLPHPLRTACELDKEYFGAGILSLSSMFEQIVITTCCSAAWILL